MIVIADYVEFTNCIIAQDDDQDYSESGWVAVVKDKEAALARYSHCSCYGTWEAIAGDGQKEANWVWEGTVEDLVLMAALKEDPDMKGRTADPSDYDYDHLMNVYDQVLVWAKGQGITINA